MDSWLFMMPQVAVADYVWKSISLFFVEVLWNMLDKDGSEDDERLITRQAVVTAQMPNDEEP